MSFYTYTYTHTQHSVYVNMYTSLRIAHSSKTTVAIPDDALRTFKIFLHRNSSVTDTVKADRGTDRQTDVQTDRKLDRQTE